MHPDEYKNLTDQCDAVLREFISDPQIIAIPWLHVLNGHANSIAQYKYVFRKRSFLNTAGFFLYSSAHAVYKILSSVFRFHTTIITPHGKAEVLFVSHLIGTKTDTAGADFYFGTLPLFLEKKNIKTVTGLIDHTPGQKSIQQKKEIENGLRPKALFPKNLSPAKEWWIAKNNFSSFGKLLGKYFKEKDPVAKSVLYEAALHAITPETGNALRIGLAVKETLEQTGASILCVTWEGRSWERIAINHARNRNVSVRCAGYQHTILLESSHAVKNSLAPQYDPDVIFTTGNITADILRTEGNLIHTNIVPYGSYRFTKTKSDLVKHTAYCLVAPEGIESECVLLFSFAKKVALQFPQMHFIFRTHPVLPYELLTTQYPSLSDLPVNCSVSVTPDIQDDFKRCSFLLYRGSSVAVYAVLNRLRPVYLSLPEEISIDPLYLIRNWKLVTHTTEDFIEQVKKAMQQNNNESEEAYKQALAFCTEYAIPVDENIFSRLFFSCY